MRVGRSVWTAILAFTVVLTMAAGSAGAHEGADDGAHHGAAGALASDAGAAAAAPGDPFKALVFSKTAGFRHDSIAAGIAAIQQLGTANNFAVTATEDAAAFTDENLAQFDTVIFLSTTGDVLNDTQQASFERYIRAGGGYTGVHAAADTEYSWAWYGGLVGAYFDSHPPGTPTATVEVHDKAHPSTKPLPDRWTRTDEWYNYRTNPRGNVHVLATLNESTYTGGNMGNDHPIIWCQDYEGGRSWYTGGGHTQASFSETLFREHLLRGIQWSAGIAEGDCGGTVWNNFERKTLAEGSTKLGEAIALAAMPDGRVLHTARDGRVFLTNAAGTETKLAASIPVYQHDEDGLQSVALDPDFATNKWVYLYYAPTLNTPGGDAPNNGTQAQFDAFKGHNVLSRFKFENDQLVRSTEQKILEVPADRGICCHAGGDIGFDKDGNLFLSTGDDTNPFASQGYTPIDETAGRNPAYDAQRSSGNTNDLRGKLLRIKVAADGTYAVPPGNLFPLSEPSTRPEIYAMGFRNPFRFSVDKRTGYVYLGEYGPDAGAPSATRGPGGQVEFNIIKGPGNYGWPYCHGPNDAYLDYNFATQQSGAAFNCAAPVNTSPNNTGKTNLPPAIAATAHYGNTPPTFADLNTGGSESPMGGPVYNYDAALNSDTKFPAYYDNHWFPYEWGNSWIRDVALDANGDILEVNPFLVGQSWNRGMDMEFGPNGSLYILEYGTGAFGGAFPNSRVTRIDYVGGQRSPIAQAAADPSSGSGVPLTVQFSSAGSRDPDGDPITYEWDFGDNTAKSTEPNPTHTYATAGDFNAVLTVKDASGKTGSASVTVTVGNSRPVVKIEAPVNGGFFEFGDQVRYKVTVTDAEDGAIDCSKVEIDYILGHDSHGHPLSDATGCEGVIQTNRDEGHGDDANVFGVITASYTDKGGNGTSPLTARDEIQLQPKRKQAEHFSTNNGGQIEATGDTAGGASNVGFLDNNDSLSYKPVNFKDITAMRLRVASGSSGGTVEARLGSPTGTLLGTAAVTNTGGWQVYQDKTITFTDPGGTHELFLVFKGGTGGLMNINWIDFIGKGVTENQRPSVTATATPDAGSAPLQVSFSANATDPEGDAPFTYKWNFGVAGAPAPATKDATYTYTTPGTYTATVTATDAKGAFSSGKVTVRVAAPPDPGSCEQVRSDEFTGTALDTNRWMKVVRPDATGYSLGGGFLTIKAGPGDVYQGTNNAKNLILQPTPSGAWSATTKVTFAPTANYQQAGLIVYGDDANYAKLDMIWAGSSRKFEFIRETNGTARNAAEDSTPGLAIDFPTTVYLRVTSDGTNLTAAYSVNGDDFTPVGRAAALAGINTPHVGPFALNGTALAAAPEAKFDWVRITPDQPKEQNATPDDEFTGTGLNECRWSQIVRPDKTAYRVQDGALQIDTQAGDIYSTGNTNPKNLILQPAPAGDWTIETKMDAGALNEQYQQGGLMIYEDDDNYVKFDLVLDNVAGSARIPRLELRSEVAGAVQQPQQNVAFAATDTAPIHLRVRKVGTNYTGSYSRDGVAWTTLAQPVANATLDNIRFGVFAIGVAQQASKTVSFDYFLVDGRDGADTQAPTTTATLDPAAPNGSAGWYTSPVNVTLAAADAGGGTVASTQYKVDDGAYQPYTAAFPVAADGSHTVTFRSTDAAGNVETEKTVSFKIDKTAPASSATVPAPGGQDGWHTADVAVTLAGTDAGSGVAATEYKLGDGAYQAYTAPFTLATEGTTTVTYRSKDAAGNVGAEKTETVKLDKTAPTATATLDPAQPGDGGTYIGPVKVALAGADAAGGSGLGVLQYRLDGGDWLTYGSAVTVSGDGAHTVDYRARDAAGNVGETKTVAFSIDSGAPATTATLTPGSPDGSEGWYRSPVQVALKADEDAATTEYAVDGGAYEPYSAAFTVGTDGSHTVAFRSRDRAGNVEVAKSVSFKIDRTAPSLQVSGVADAARYGDSGTRTVSFVGADAASGIGPVSATLDGKPIAFGTELVLYKLDLGVHTLVISGTDRAGNAATRTVKFEVTTSFADVQNLLGQFRQANRMTAKQFDTLKKAIDAARREAERDRKAAAIKELETFKAGLKPLADAEVKAVLTRDADALIVSLGGRPTGATLASVTRTISVQKSTFARKGRTLVNRRTQVLTRSMVRGVKVRTAK